MTFEKKPWGSEEILELNNEYMVKRLTILKGHRSSLHYHKSKKETFILLKGLVDIYLYDDISCKSFNKVRLDETNPVLTLDINRVHRIVPITDIILYESSTPFPNDTWRLEDDYKRE